MKKQLVLRKKLFLLFVGFFATLGANAQMLAVNTDVATDLLQMPSLGFELVTGERTSLSLNAMGGYNPWGKEVKVMVLQPEFRCYLSGRPMSREFIGLGALASNYDIHWAGKVYDGHAIGMGLTFGYVYALSKRLNLDIHAGFAAIFYRQKEYYEGDLYDVDYPVNGVLHPNAHGYTLLPTRIGVSFTYILK